MTPRLWTPPAPRFDGEIVRRILDRPPPLWRPRRGLMLPPRGLVAPLGLVVSVNGTPTQASFTADPTDVTHTVPSLTDGAILVLIVGNGTGPPTIAAMTWDAAGANQALTLVGNHSLGSRAVEIWALVNPTAGASKALTIDSSAAWSSFCRAVVINLEGVLQDTVANAFTSYAEAAAASGNPTVTLTTAIGAGNMAIDAVYKSTNVFGVMSPDSGQTQIKNELVGGFAIAGVSRRTVDAAMSWTLTAGTDGGYVIAACEIEQATIGGIVVNPMRGPFEPIGYAA